MNLPNLYYLDLIKTQGTDVGAHYLSKSSFKKLKELRLGDNPWREQITKLTKADWKLMEWISLSPYGNTFSKLGFFGCQKLLASELNEVQFIFLPQILLDKAQIQQLVNLCQNRLKNNARFYTC